MIQIATFTRKFFIELVKQLQIYGTLYVTEDGNIYVNESQAQTRCQSREKLAHLNGELVQELRYARVDKSNPPKDTAEFEEMLENQFRARQRPRRNATSPSCPMPRQKPCSKARPPLLRNRRRKPQQRR